MPTRTSAGPSKGPGLSPQRERPAIRLEGWEAILEGLRGLFPLAQAEDRLSSCACGGDCWESVGRCPSCMRPPLPSDTALRLAFDRAPKIEGEHTGRVRRLDPGAVRATPPKQIKRGTRMWKTMQGER